MRLNTLPHLKQSCSLGDSTVFGFAAVCRIPTAKFHSSTSIGYRIIAVCAKVQDGGRRRRGFYFIVDILAYVHVGPPT